MTNTVADILDLRAEDDRPGLLFEDSRWTWREFVEESVRRAHLLLEMHDPERPFHIAVMLENVPEYLFAIAGAAYAGATVVGVNLTRRGDELAEQIRYTDCELILTDSTLVHHIEGLDIGMAADRVLVMDTPAYEEGVNSYAGRPTPVIEAAREPVTQLLLLFTSGSTGKPKAVICSTGRFARIARAGGAPVDLGPDDVSYNSMPLFHGNALFACWANPMYVGGTFALARKFSASGFVDDVIRHRATFFNYVGRSLAYILAQPERPEEAQTSLRTAYGTEASKVDREELERRFGVTATESYGASEGGLAFGKSPDSPEESLGLAPEGMRAAVIDPGTLQECPRARFDRHGRMLNADEAIGELVNLDGARLFEGYYKNPAAQDERTRGDIFLTGDLGYRDEKGFFYFAGRGGDRIRVDSENFSAAPVERILARFPAADLVAVYAVPDERTGDQLMATLQTEDPVGLDVGEFADFLLAQRDLGTKWAPKFLRIVTDVPITATQKIDKRRLRREGWEVDGLIYVRPTAHLSYVPLSSQEKVRMREAFVSNGRINLMLQPAMAAR